MCSTGISLPPTAAPGRSLAPLKTEMAGIGPVVSYISTLICGRTLVAKLKWLPQMDTFRTLKGDHVSFKVGLAL
ncbi:hypothetical protein SBDP1_220037 [Syntrophobacter sp. SbD1]|nr:hypothetical protein SBDP1_220037 [Syntrophobacter sp. SbD1]